MRLKHSTIALLIGAIVALGFLIGGAASHFLEPIAVSYPFDVWRMDLDDTLANIGIFLGGLAAFLVVFKRARKVEERVERVEHKINGGLSSLASQILKDEIKQYGLDIEAVEQWMELSRRLALLEQSEHDCLLREDDLKGWVREQIEAGHLNHIEHDHPGEE